MDLDVLLEIAMGTEYCPECGSALLGESSHFCDICGERISVPAQVPEGFLNILVRMKAHEKEKDKSPRVIVRARAG